MSIKIESQTRSCMMSDNAKSISFTPTNTLLGNHIALVFTSQGGYNNIKDFLRKGINKVTITIE